MINSADKINCGLDLEDIQKIQSVFSDFMEVAMVKIYGSRAMGNFKPASDIDLCLFGEKLNLTTQQEIEFALDDLMLPYKFDVSTYHDISNPDLLGHIDRVGKVFYSKN
ncbi:nucleotidyltransferase domain-containing protein [Belliella sp. R4-6]|uniref:Nucleotidyltransferase domain-containing protein n=1 Tax=Belliella alkalica TaxID=1730871 RepID=A0ABS9VEL0_9BACT|nr:nucleotidyltransferase domain-containing protein [Belliella alkalica]MCH7414881.1 nucleotidyltransferase domain-containing protein [Belliella alkalica]